MEKEIKIEVGNTYETRDGRKVIVFKYNSISNDYSAVVFNTNDFLSVHEDGKYYETNDSHNDLVKLIK